MLIEIKDLPPGQKIKKISVDITFEDSGEIHCEQTVDTRDSAPVSDKQFIPEPPSPPNPPESRIIKEDGKVREHKEIPPEMKDMEF